MGKSGKGIKIDVEKTGETTGMELPLSKFKNKKRFLSSAYKTNQTLGR